MTLDELRTRNVGTVAEVIEAFFDGKCDERTFRRGIDAGQIPAIKIGNKTLIPIAPLLAMIEAPAPPAFPAPSAEDPAGDALTAVREILRGALRALEVLTGYQGEDHGGATAASGAGQDDSTGGRSVPRLLEGGRGVG